ncbi:MAG: type IV toxin-antitoxin system AbiEi family antitoxin domain-containing protein [Alkalispirochaeta sp.]
MQPLARLRDGLGRLTDAEHYLFSATDLRPLMPEQSDQAFRRLLSRAVRSGVLERICRGIYLYPYVDYQRGYELCHAAARLRAGTLTYISLESALSNAGIISQVPVGHLTLMTTGRSSTISCGRYGVIECIHTKRSIDRFSGDLIYDPACRLWRASPALAVRDLKAVGRSLDLVDWEAFYDSL